VITDREQAGIGPEAPGTIEETGRLKWSKEALMGRLRVTDYDRAHAE
jgi:hypothetical protein